jgi:hypothetical protein
MSKLSKTDNITYEFIEPVNLASKSDPVSSASDNKINASYDASSTDAEFNAAVANFIKRTNPKLYILTPCYGSMCYVNYMVCLISTIELFRKLNIQLQVEFCRNDSLVPRARNNLIAKAMNDQKMTHMLFIDCDITWNPMDIVKLLLDDKPVNGGIYPLKRYCWDKLIRTETGELDMNIIKSWLEKKEESPLKSVMKNEEMIQSKLLKYNVNYLDNVLNINNNLAAVRHIATGFMMIQRNVIEKMSKAFPSTKYTDDVGFLSGSENNYAFALFDCGVDYDHYLSEDFMFSDRWRKMGGEIFCNVSVNLMHTGQEDFKGSFIASLLL